MHVTFIGKWSFWMVFEHFRDYFHLKDSMSGFLFQDGVPTHVAFIGKSLL
jgi:hypothetical protein